MADVCCVYFVCETEALVGAMCATLLLVLVVFVVILIYIIRRYRRYQPTPSNQATGSSSSSSSSSRDAEQENYDDPIRDPSQQHRRVWQSAMTLGDR